MTEAISIMLHRRTMERFDKEIEPSGKRWAPLSEYTLGDPRAGAQGRRILNRTGKLRSSIRIIRGGLGSTFTNTGAGARIGIQDPEMAEIGAALNKGVQGRIPARKFLGIGPTDIASVDAYLRRRGNEALR
jgi:phage gpG-like protein